MSRNSQVVLRYPFRLTWKTFGPVSMIGPDASETLAISLALAYDSDSARAQLQAANGSFAVVIDTETYLLAATDRVRSIPLFYRTDPNSIVVTDHIAACSTRAVPDLQTQADFAAQYCCPGQSTLLSGWKQLQAGEFLFLDKRSGSVHVERYHRFDQTGHTGVPDPGHIQEVYLDVFRSIVASAAGRTLILPLSGGYDSRCIAACLKMLGAGPVFCYTYGRADSAERAVAQHVAATLGFDWHFVEYDEKTLDVFLTPEWFDYADCNHHFSSLPHEQDFFALYELRRRGLLPADGIVLPGFLGDYFAGSMFKGNVETADAARSQDTYISDRGCKFIVNAVRVYEYFGLDWRLPFASREIMDLWFGVDWRLRYFGNAYNDRMSEVFFIPLGIDLRKPDHAYKKRPVRTFLESILPGKLLRSIRSFRSYLPQNDPNHTRYLLEKLHPPEGVLLNKFKMPFNEAHARYFLDRLPQLLRIFD